MRTEPRATAQLNRQMPALLAGREEILGSAQKTLASIEARLSNLETRINQLPSG